jgi:putative nucleotidyltransferase with HDIG domain
MSPDELRRSPEVAALRLAVIAQTQGLSVVRVKVYNTAGQTIFSTDTSQIGEDKSANAGFQAALSGGVASELTHRDTISAFEGTLEDRDVISSYVPIRSGPGGPVEGVFEVYDDVTPLLAQIERTQRIAYGGVAVLLSTLYAVLFFIVRRADGIIRAHSQAQRQVEAELEERVDKRTAGLEALNEILFLEIDQRRSAEERERKQRLLSETLTRLGLALSATHDINLLLEEICEASMELFGVDAAYLWLVQGDELVGFAGLGGGLEEFLGTRVKISDAVTLGARVVRQKEAIFVNDTFHSGEVNRKLIERLSVRSILGVPLLNEEKAVGALMIVDRQNAQRFSENDMETAIVLGSYAAVAIEKAELVEGLQHTNLELTLAYDTTLEGWAHALELRDQETLGHTRRVTEMTLKLARALGVSESEFVHLRRGAMLHDIGKMGIPDDVLLKPGPLTEEEWVIMRRHTEYAKDMLSEIEFLDPALDIPYLHHEKWDGSGYPCGLKGEEIPLAARIFAVADVWDALRSDRPYRAAWPDEKALAYVRAEAGSYFDPRIVEAFLGIVEGEEQRERIAAR